MKVGKQQQHEAVSPPSQQHRTRIGVYNTKKVEQIHTHTHREREREEEKRKDERRNK